MRKWHIAASIAASLFARGVIPATASARDSIKVRVSRGSPLTSTIGPTPAAGTTHNCYTFPGEQCFLHFNMNPGTAIVQTRFSDGANPTNHPDRPYVEYSCTVVVTATPGDEFTVVEDFYVNRPNIRHIEVN